MNFKTIKFAELEAGIGLITLNRPECLNALSLEMVEELRTLFGQLQSQERVRVIIVTGEGRGFCSGADLKDERLRLETPTPYTHAAGHLVKVQKKYGDLVLQMRHISQPINPYTGIYSMSSTHGGS